MIRTTLSLSLFAIALLPIAAVAQSPSHAASHHKVPSKAEPVLPPLTNEERAQQVLARFTFGPRPGDVAAVTKIGWEVWFEQQLNPDSISNADLDKRLAAFPSLTMAPPQVAMNFPDGGVIRQIDAGKLAMPQDPMLAGAYEVMLERYKRKQARDAAANQTQSASMPVMQTNAEQAPPPIDMEDEPQSGPTAQTLADQILGYQKGLRMQAIMRLPAEQRMILCRRVTDPQRTMLMNDFTPREREIFQMMGGGAAGIGVAQNELQQAKILRAILSERQLEEVMTDFWFNHFNIFLHKNPIETYYLADYERNAIREHALGKFKDLLLATAEHPAMLDYLDNRTSIGPDSLAANRQKANPKQQDRGLNENYGREVMELHTVSVNGGYTQADVTNLAKIFTGWTIDHPELGGPFVFNPRWHEPGTKKWFGQTIKENGFNEGVLALTWLAAQPQTAHFISYKLAQRFVADEPPPALVDRMAQTYLSSDGDIKQVLRTMVHSPEFWSRTNYRNKVKTPLEFVASAFRSTDTNPTNPGALVGTLARMGEPLYQMQPPTGYPMTADHWMNSAALVDRLNFSMQLTTSKLGGMKFDAPHLLADGLLARPATSPDSLHRVAVEPAIMTQKAAVPSGQDEALELMEQLLIAGDVSAKTNSVIREQLAQTAAPADATQQLDTMSALILGSPEFQMR
ncbi:DUF1800 domain-containing protein [Alloacidobacterium dinghuense]|uniref:DUF1800 domain-containing protein n=1 Tax=Alloacidobacterium dinghuense TaxID=2763107 RepID=A0A7G8BIL6_9BACT|nr:DUF1800 domain-containing protein [Alloacidobacterium dinghuense]QNI32386.1 DUF1800 domain-containing protein [Alloacidobacterium dinghuense]